MKTVWVLLSALLLTCTGMSASAAEPERPGDSSIAPLGFFWQLIAPQEVIAGALLVALPERPPGTAKKARSTRSDQEFFAVSSTGSNDVPEAALRAYHHAE